MEHLERLIELLKSEYSGYSELNVPEDFNEKRRLLRSLMNVRMPGNIPKGFLELQDAFLKNETELKGIVRLDNIPTVRETLNNNEDYADKISIWQGDITRLGIDAIVNAANNKLLGCFIPCHRCIDNAIHSAAGIELREECNYIMIQQGHDEPVGSAKLTKGYNLPCKYVIHTVGPIVSSNLNEGLKNDLASCYRSCMEIAVQNGIRSIAFCCISTGEFHFPNDEAARIAVDTVQKELKRNSGKFDRVIFNVFKEIDKEIYERLLRG